jgi:hypothetical protein
MAYQGNWRWCNKCQVLCFAGGPVGPCQAGGDHDHTGSFNYVLILDDSSAPGQAGWKWCRKCQELCWSQSDRIGNCPAGGAHDTSASGTYTLCGGQENWRWCDKCQAMYFAGNPAAPCPEGGTHNQGGSPAYAIIVTG